MNFHLLTVLVITAVFLAGFMLPILSKRAAATQLSLGLALVGSLLGAWWTGSVLVNKQPISTTIISMQTEWFAAGSRGIELPPLSWALQLDNLSAFYGFLITAFAAVVAVYSFAALQAVHYQKQRGRIAAAFNLFVWSTLMVVLVSDLFSLIVVLEIMTLAFGFLTLYKHTLYQDSSEPVAKRQAYLAALAPKTYMIISHVSTAFLIVPLLLLAINAGGVSFELIAAHKTELPLPVASVVFLLALVGAGIRAGLTPFHFWVPIVHPASPTTTHAFSLGIGIKVAIYLMVRFFFQFLQPQPWWGYVLLLVAVITALVNVWFAIVSHDLKTALAYHSIENVGIIVAGLGVALIFVARQQENMAFFVSLALVASFYHTLNHAVFKGLLYLATGAIDNLTGQVVRFDKLGGLMKLYPVTAAVFIVGAISISGFPPFNGFVSEWLTVQALLKGGYALRAEPFKLIMLLVALVGLAAAFALTAFCFYKMVGLTFMGHSRSSEAERAGWSQRDVPWMMRGMMVLMALLCLLLALFPGQVESLLQPVTAVVLNNSQIPTIPISWKAISFPTSEDLAPSFEIGLIFIVAVGLGGLAAFLRMRRPARRVPAAWSCGTTYDSETMQPTSSTLSFLLRDWMRHPHYPIPTPDYLPAQIDVSESKTYPQSVIEPFRLISNRLIDWTVTQSTRLGNQLQNKDIRHYLWYIFIVNIVALLLFLLFGDIV